MAICKELFKEPPNTENLLLGFYDQYFSYLKNDLENRLQTLTLWMNGYLCLKK